MDQQIQTLRRKLEAEPDNAEALSSLARALAHRGAHAEACELLVDHGALERDDPLLYEIGAPLAAEQRPWIEALPGLFSVALWRDELGWEWLERADVPRTSLILAIKLVGRSGDDLMPLGSVPHICVLDLTSIAPADVHLEDLPKNLRELYLFAGRLTDRALGLVGDLSRLRALTISDAHHLSSQALGRLRSLVDLRSLSLEGYHDLDNTGLDQLAALTRLKHLALTRCPELDDRSLAHLARLTRLETLDLTGTPILTPGIQVLASLKQLRRLDLSGAGLKLAPEEARAALPGVEIVFDPA